MKKHRKCQFLFDVSQGLICPVESQLCLEVSLHSLTLHSSLVHAGVCEREGERIREILIMCVEFLTNSLPFADPTFLWNHHRNNSEKNHKFQKGLFTRQSLSWYSPVWSLCFPSSSGTSRSCRSRYSRTGPETEIMFVKTCK